MPPRTAAPRMARATQGTIYRKGVAPKGALAAAPDSDDSEAGEDDEKEAEDDEAIEEKVNKREGLVIRKDPSAAVLRVKELDLKPKLVAKPIDEEDLKPSPAAQAAATKEESSEYETDSSEEESEEEEPPKPLYKPVFVAKRNRETVPLDSEAQRIAQEEADERERLARIQASHDLVGQALAREVADKEKADAFPDVDDTDGLDPEGEFDAWRLRELQRIKRDQDALYEREREREEVERRRAMPEQLRLKEDLEHAQRTRDGKQRGQQVFLQKYHHKGVFYTEADIMKRDYTAPTEGTIIDVASLPAAMQKHAGKFGKRSQTKYTHLKDQDTTSDSAGWAKRSGLGGKHGDPGGGGGGQSGCFNCGGDHMKKDCPQMRSGAGPSQSGANAGARDAGWSARIANDPRRDRGRSRSRSPPRRARRSASPPPLRRHDGDDDDDRDRGRSGASGAGYRRERGRSGSRDRSLERDRADRDKRRRRD